MIANKTNVRGFTTPIVKKASGIELRRLRRYMIPPPIRTMREFAEQEIRIPDGPRVGEDFDCRVQPYTGHLLDLIDTGLWNRMFFPGPTQSGKSFCAFGIPIMYHVFERQENGVIAAPTAAIAWQKWIIDLRPMIERSRFKDLLPTHGTGSRGGKTEFLQFKNGVNVSIMTAGGGDESRAHFTARWVAITELDDFDEVGHTSDETTKFQQIEGRTRAFGSNKRIYGECTVGMEDGATWHEFMTGTRTELYIRCQHCREYVLPEREDLQGAHGQADVITAREQAAFACPSCKVLWTEADRIAANRDMVPVHRGQHVDNKGKVHGKMPRTNTLGLRWSGVHNMFQSTADLAEDEHRAEHAPNEDAAERKQLQQVWTKPYVPSDVDLSQLSAEMIRGRVIKDRKHRQISKECKILVGAADIGKRAIHWEVAEVSEGFRVHTIDYGVAEVPPWKSTGKAIGVALRQLADDFPTMFDRPIDQMFVDSGGSDRTRGSSFADAVYGACIDINPHVWKPIKGYAETMYSPPAKRSQTKPYIGEQMHLSRVRPGVVLMIINSDYWRGFVHDGWRAKFGQAGAFTLYMPDKEVGPPEQVHHSYAKHQVAKKYKEVFDEKQGRRMIWTKGRNNHWLDVKTYLSAGAHFLGARIDGWYQPRPRRSRSDGGGNKGSGWKIGR